MVVAVRIRPLSQQEKDRGCKSTTSVLNDNVVTIKRDCRDGGFLRSQMAQLNEYGFDSAFNEESTQQDVYRKTAQPFIPNLLAGMNVTVFAYGATGAGKTHTMLGNSRVDEATSHTSDAGIIPQAVKDLFDRIEAKQQVQARGESWTVTCTFVEIYNEQVYDLLQSTGKPLSLREDRGQVLVAGVNETVTNSAEDVMDLLAAGNKNRKTEATMANAVSSRSHAVLQLCLKHVTRSADSGREAAMEAKLSLIDLAGSERASATNNRGARLHEGANINKSLLALANCINALASNSSSGRKMNVKYRDSRLTHLLKSSLEGGNCNLVMIANINPSHTTFEDSHNTLKYANRAKNIKVNPTANAAAVESNWMLREENLRDENKALRARVMELETLVATLQAAAANGTSDSGNEAAKWAVRAAVADVASITNKHAAAAAAVASADSAFTVPVPPPSKSSQASISKAQAFAGVRASKSSEDFFCAESEMEVVEEVKEEVVEVKDKDNQDNNNSSSSRRGGRRRSVDEVDVAMPPITATTTTSASLTSLYGVPVVAAKKQQAEPAVVAANPFMEAILPAAAPGGSRKRKADIDAAAPAVDDDAMTMAMTCPDIEPMIDNEGKGEDEVRAAVEVEVVPTIHNNHNSNSKNSGAVGIFSVPDKSISTSALSPGPSSAGNNLRNLRVRRSSFGSVGEKKQRGSAISIFSDNDDTNNNVAFVAAEPSQQKPTAVSKRRKSLAAVSAMLDSIVDENAFDENKVMPKRELPDLNRVLRSNISTKGAPVAAAVLGKGGGKLASFDAAAHEGSSSSSTCQQQHHKKRLSAGSSSSRAKTDIPVVQHDSLSEEVWIDI
jgi:kinesin family protein 18/19